MILVNDEVATRDGGEVIGPTITLSPGMTTSQSTC